jgi:hypothetical protein
MQMLKTTSALLPIDKAKKINVEAKTNILILYQLVMQHLAMA